MTELLRFQGLLGKIESAYKTDPTPSTSTDGIQVEEALHSNMTWGYLEENLRENLAGSAMGRYGQEVPVGRWMNIEITAALKGTGAAYTASVKPEVDVLLRACGLTGTVGGSTGAETLTYSMASTGFESCTLWVYSGSKLYKVNGVRGSVNFMFTPGQVPTAVFTMRGYLASVTQLDLPTISYPYSTIIPPVVKGAGLTLNSVDPAGFDDLSLDLGCKTVDLPNGNDADGFAGVVVTDYDPRIKLTIERAALSAFDPYTLHQNGTRFAWDWSVGTVQYNQIAFSGGAGRIVAHSGPEKDGLAMTQLEIQAQHSDADTEDAVTIVFS